MGGVSGGGDGEAGEAEGCEEEDQAGREIREFRDGGRGVKLNLLRICLLVLAAAPSVSLMGQAAPETKTCTAKPEWITKISKPEGWDTSFVGNARRPPFESPFTSGPELASIDQTEYPAREKYFAWTEVVVDSCLHSASLKTQHLLIQRVYGYALNGKTFAYGVFGNCGSLEKGVWVAAGCDTTLLLTDTTGNGRFDSLQFGVWAPKSVPDWLEK